MSRKMNRIYKSIAKKNGISVDEVKQEIQHAINITYERPTLYAKCISCRKKVPSIEEFIQYSAKRVSLNKLNSTNKK